MRRRMMPVLSCAFGVLLASGCGPSTKDAKEDGGGDGPAAQGSLLLADLCARQAATPSQVQHRDLLLDDVSAFAADLTKQALPGNTNAVISPFSVQLAFGMLRVGAEGETKGEIEKAVRLQGKGYDLDTELAALSGDLRCLPPNAEGTDLASVGLHIANAVWGTLANPLADAYVTNLRETFAAESRTLDFGEAAQAADAINGWTKEATFDKIPSVVTPADFSAATIFALTNAIHFKSGWDQEFAESETKDEAFHGAQGDLTVKTMHLKLAPLYYSETEGYLAVEFPFKDDAGSLRIYLPKAQDGLAAFVKGVDAATLSSSKGWSEGQVNVSLPKFQIDASHDLATMLESLGLHKVFTPAAELGAMLQDPTQAVQVSAARQKTFIDVNEKGVEAAAVTVIAGEGAGAPGEPPPVIDFKADHPFFFSLESDGAVLFTGTYVGP